MWTPIGSTIEVYSKFYLNQQLKYASGSREMFA